MKRTSRRRRYRRRKAAEQANRISHPTAVAERSSAPSEPAEEPIVGIMPDEHSEKIDLPFEIAHDKEDLVASEEPSGDASQPTARDEHKDHADAADDDHASIVEERVAKEPSAEELLYNAAREAHAQGEKRRAIAIYRELLSIVPTHVRARNNLALLLDQNGEHEEALHELKLCLNSEPTNPQVLVNRGGVLG